MGSPLWRSSVGAPMRISVNGTAHGQPTPRLRRLGEPEPAAGAGICNKSDQQSRLGVQSPMDGTAMRPSVFLPPPITTVPRQSARAREWALPPAESANSRRRQQTDPRPPVARRGHRKPCQVHAQCYRKQHHQNADQESGMGQRISHRRGLRQGPGSGIRQLGIHAACRQSIQTRRKTRDPLVPPKPKLFLSATSIFMSRAVLAQ